MFGKTATGVLAGAAALAGTFAPSAAYEIADVCSVEIGVLYTAGGGVHHGKLQKFTITGMAPDGYLQIAPGTFTLTVDGKLCSTHSDHPSQGGAITDAFMGITSYTLSENEIATASSKIDVICLDQEPVASSDSAVEMAPIIISIAIDSNVLQIGETATVTVGAVDPNNGENPGQYVFSMDNGGSTGSAAGSCASGSCAATYTASTGESGNQPFTFSVRDHDFGSNSLQDTVTGNIIVDDSGSVQFGLENYHRPSGLTVSIATGDEHLAYGETATITITSTDIDLVNTGLASPDSLDLRGDPFTDNYKDGNGLWVFPVNSGGTAAQQYVLKQVYGNEDITADGADDVHDDLACNLADLSVVSSSVAGDTKTWVVEWNPWLSASGSQADYGLVACAFDFQAFDSRNLLSDTVQVSLTATATDQDPSFSEIPFFESIMIDDISPVVGNDVEIRMFYSDTGGGNAVDFALSLPAGSAMISQVQRCDIDPGTDMATNCDSPVAWSDGVAFTFNDATGCAPTGSGGTYVSGCQHILKVTTDVSAQTGFPHAENVITLTITDSDSGYADYRVLSNWNLASSRRMKRSEAGQGHDGFALSFTVSPGAGGSTNLVASMANAGEMSSESEVGAGAGADVGAIVGAVVGAVGVVGAVAAIVVRRRAREAAGANIDLGSTWESDGGATTIV